MELTQMLPLVRKELGRQPAQRRRRKNGMQHCQIDFSSPLEDSQIQAYRYCLEFQAIFQHSSKLIRVFSNERTCDVLMAGEISVSTTDVLKSSTKLSMSGYVSEWMNACKSEGDTICFVGTTNSSAVILSRNGVR